MGKKRKRQGANIPENELNHIKQSSTEPESTQSIVTSEYSDKKREAEIEMSLSEAETRIRINPYVQSTLDFTRESLIALLNFMNKYSKTKEEIPIITRVIKNFEGNPLLYIESLNNYMFSRFHSIYGFGLQSWNQKNWRLKTLESLQIDDKLAYNDPIFDSALLRPKVNVKLMQESYIDDWYVRKSDNDLLQLIGGVRRQGKSTVALWKLINTYKIRGETTSIKNIIEWLKYNIIYTNEESVSHKLLELEEDILIVDEGFFTVYNLNSMQREVVTIAQNMNATANRHNIYLICMSELGAATKPIQRLATGFYWIPRRGVVNKYVKSKNWINAKDPLALDPINKLVYESQINKALINHKFYITRMSVKPLPDRWEKEYKAIKLERQAEKLGREEAKALNATMDDKFIDKLVGIYESGDKDLKTYLMDNDVPNKIAKKYIDATLDRVHRNRLLLEAESQDKLDK